MYVSRKKNVCKSQNTMSHMKPFFLYFQLMTYVFLLVPLAVMVFMKDPSYFQDFLSFLKCINTLF